MEKNAVVSHDDWIAARKDLLAKEKQFTKVRDQLTKARRELPWEKMEKDYVFDGPNGRENLTDLFAGRSQLVVYHFMFGADWDEGCPSCSFLADHYEPAIIHLAHRDVTMVTVSIAPLDVIEPFRKRMGWDFKWVSSAGSDFNRDFGVSFTEEELASGDVDYNYARQGFPATEAPGLSVFARDGSTVYHTYSTYGRGLDIFLTVYNLLDCVPKGRDEDGLDYTMAWVRHHDRYED